MKKIVLFVLSLLTACTFLPPVPPVDKLVATPIEHPFFSIPPMNQGDYESRTWILLAESSSKAWFYDPYSLTEDDDDVVSYDAFFVPRSDKDNLQQFNATMVGPYRQKIDCFSNHQWSETFYADKMPNQETYKNPQRPNLEYGWIKIKPSTALAYVRARICGRKFIDNKNVNYFLYQEGEMRYKSPKIVDLADSSVKSGEPKEDAVVVLDSATVNVPIFYDVINNEVQVIDTKKDTRSMSISAFFLNKNITKKADYLFVANCKAKTYSFTLQGKSPQFQELDAPKKSLTSVAFDRACGEHGQYMTLIASGKNK